MTKRFTLYIACEDGQIFEYNSKQFKRCLDIFNKIVDEKNVDGAIVRSAWINDNEAIYQEDVCKALFYTYYDGKYDVEFADKNHKIVC